MSHNHIFVYVLQSYYMMIRTSRASTEERDEESGAEVRLVIKSNDDNYIDDDSNIDDDDCNIGEGDDK